MYKNTEVHCFDLQQVPDKPSNIKGNADPDDQHCF
jgi:hypothetical protein